MVFISHEDYNVFLLKLSLFIVSISLFFALISAISSEFIDAIFPPNNIYTK